MRILSSDRAAIPRNPCQLSVQCRGWAAGLCQPCGLLHILAPSPTRMAANQSDMASSKAAASPDTEDTTKGIQLDFQFFTPHVKSPKAGGESPKTPAMNGNGTPLTPLTPAEEESYDDFIADVLLWNSAIRSSFYLAVSALLLSILTYAQHGGHGLTLMAGLSYLLLADLAFNFFVAHGARPWAGTSLHRFILGRANSCITGAAKLHDTYQTGMDAGRSLKVALLLWALALAGRHFSLLSLLWAGLAAAFTLPALYRSQQKLVDKKAAEAWREVKVRYDGLSRKAKGAAVGVPVLLLMLLAPFTDIAAAIFIAILYARTLLRPSELEAIHRRADPIMSTVRKAQRNVTDAAAEMANKYGITPRPASRAKPHWG